MHSAPFRYYVHAYINYLLGKQSEHDTDAATCFLDLIELKAGLYQEAPRTIWERIKETVELTFIKWILRTPGHTVNFGGSRDYEQDDLRAVWLRVKETIEHIRNNPVWFDWNESLYGNLEARATRLLAWDGE